MDYYAAGLLDRAERAFLPLQHKRDFAGRSLECLLNIYQREKDWNKAINALRRLRRTGKPGHRESIAQFRCELAQQHANRGEDEQALRSARRALNDDRNCVRALLLSARLLAKQRAWPEFREIIAAIEQHSPEFLPEILDVAVEFQAHEGGESRVHAWLAHAYEHCGCIEAAVLLSQRLAAQSGAAAAVSYLLAAAQRTPSTLLSRNLLNLMLKGGHTQDADSFKSVIPALLEVIPGTSCRYLCSQCGFQGAELHWRCPSCQTWEAVKPAKR
jgi:lipopolysaccharide biosynthesis regulator YciM